MPARGPQNKVHSWDCNTHIYVYIYIYIYMYGERGGRWTGHGGLEWHCWCHADRFCFHILTCIFCLLPKSHLKSDNRPSLSPGYLGRGYWTPRSPNGSKPEGHHSQSVKGALTKLPSVSVARSTPHSRAAARNSSPELTASASLSAQAIIHITADPTWTDLQL